MWHLMLCLGGRREGIVGRLGILAAVALGRVRTALGRVEVGVFLGAVDVAKRARLANVLRQRRRRLGGRTSLFHCVQDVAPRRQPLAGGFESILHRRTRVYQTKEVAVVRAMRAMKMQVALSKNAKKSRAPRASRVRQQEDAYTTARRRRERVARGGGSSPALRPSTSRRDVIWF